MTNLDKEEMIRRLEQFEAPPQHDRDAQSLAGPNSGSEGKGDASSGPRSPTGPADEDETHDVQSEALYDRFVEKSRQLFEAGQEKGRDAFDKAMDRAREQLSAAGEFSAEQGALYKKYMQRDLEQTAEDMRTLGKQAEERFHPSRVGAGALSSLAKLLHATGTAMTSLSRKAEGALAYMTGEVTTAGTLTCTSCAQTVQLKSTGRVPPCPKCHGTVFRKGY
ncbi:MAG: hypothetical protein ABI537_08935 [Casimicrobiaceae bacterium]